MQEIINLISNVGFPIAITLFVLLRMEKTIKHNEKTIRDNTTAIKAMLSYVKKN